MQTFLPYPDFVSSAVCLDVKRLGKQRVEVKQIYRALRGLTSGWRNHPATRMWSGYEQALLTYGIVVCTEWRCRDYKDSLLDEFVQEMAINRDAGLPADLPWWMGSEIHRSHQSALVRKFPSHYRQFFPDVPDDIPYVWPTGRQGEPK